MIKLYWNDVKNIMRSYLLIIIPLMVIVVFFYNTINGVELLNTKEMIIEEQQQKANMLNYVIEDTFAELYEDLLVIKNSNEMSNYLASPQNQKIAEVEQLFLRVGQSKKNFDQIRLIGNNGQELVRANYFETGLELVEKENLQNKIDRNYYIETCKLEEGQIYVSDMDLNMENGILEQPYKPMIRIATPLYSSSNTFQGILIINYLGQDILDLFTQYFQENNDNYIKPYLVNQDGYYLYNNDQNKTFGFVFENKQNISIADENPLLWDDILLKKNGLFEGNNIITNYISLDPLSMIETNSNGSYLWFIISSFDLEYLPSVEDSVIFGMKQIDLLILLGISILVFILVLLRYYSQKNKEELNITRKIADNTKDAVIITNEKTEILYANAAFEKATQYKPEEVIGLKTSFFKSNKQSKDFYKDMWNSIENKGYWHGELWDKKKDGLLYPKELSIIKTKDKYSKQLRYIGMFSDITKIKEGENYLEKLKNYHLDTNLPNENLMISLINNSIQDKDKLNIIYFTIENYNQWLIESKESNEFVKILTDSIKSKIKEEDFVAQVTKNGFVIGLSSITSTTKLEEYLEDFINTNRKEFLYNNKLIYFDLKAGISIYPNDGKTANELLVNAIIASDNVVQSKEKKFEYFQPIFREQLQRESKINCLLRKATQNNELEVYYQPQIRISDGKMLGAEALIRWNSKELGFVSPVDFIPLAEKTGQIIDIGYWIIEQVISDYTRIKEDVDEEFRLSINISPAQFKDVKLFEKIKELIEKYNVNPNRFEIEITEGIFVGNFTDINSKLNQFKKLGMTIAIDDFGTGFSSLSYIKELHIDKLKIDRGFIKDYPENDNGDLAQVITNIGKKLNLEVITEGAETIEQVEYIQSIGCNLIQGFYYSRPLQFEHFTEFIGKNNKR